MDDIERIYEFIKTSEKLKSEMRHSWVSCGRNESVAEHSWRTSLMVMLISPFLKNKINTERALRLAIIHDIVEMITGDTPYHQFDSSNYGRQQIKQSELEGAKKIKSVLPNLVGKEIFDLWFEFENLSSEEAKFVNALDKLEVCIQHAQSDCSTWLESERESISPFINYLKGNCDSELILKTLEKLVISDLKTKHASEIKFK
ncbi:MAG: HD domain-containing protein (plasmid) [Candidatus Algichlamydia australiensis]|nr:HD domain-containing protein [Chlamydiales bacterium]